MRKYDDSVKPGCGIDGSKGERFTKEHASDPWNPPKLTDGISDGKGQYTDNERILRNKLPYEAGADTHSIDAEVEDQQSDDGNRAVRSRGGQT